jgi:cell division protein FtsZ
VNDLLIRNPTLVIGIGAGCKIAKQAKAAFECRTLLVSNDKLDLDDSGIYIDTEGWVNPSVFKLRSFAEARKREILSAINGYPTIVLISNLAGRSGPAISPVISRMAKQLGATVIAVAIMPFKFEKDRMFSAGTSFRRLRETSDSVIVMDNDAFLENNPELTQEQCYTLTNKAVVEILASISRTRVKPQVNVLCTSTSGTDSETSLRDSVSMLYHDIPDPSAITRTMLYVMGAQSVPLGELNKIAGYAQGMFTLDTGTEVAITPVAASDGVKVHLMASARQKTRFDRYDPLGDLFPKESVLDWDEPDSAPDISLPIPAME